MVIETELKLRLPSSKNTAFRRLMANHVATGSQPDSERLLSIYYDTPDLTLAQHDMGLRLRQVGGQWVQTLKLAEQAGAGLHQRPELEMLIDGPALTLNQIPDRKLRHFLTQDTIEPALLPLFTTDIKRTRWTLQDQHGNQLEVCLDQGKVCGQEQTLRLNEVEIELKQGNVQAVFELALALANTLPLVPDPQSKAERGYALYRKPPPPAPSKALLPSLNRKSPPEAAFRLVVQETLRHLQANVPGILDHDDMECIHQARVALRRLRSAQKAFAPFVPDEEWHVITAKVHWLATLLGQVRDLDVFLAETLPSIEAATPGDVDFTSLKVVMTERRTHLRREVHAAFTSPRYCTLLIHLLAWLNQPPAVSTTKSIKLDDYVPRSLTRRWQPVKRLGRNWQNLSPEQRHDLRKQAKKLRYTAEFFSPLYKHKPVRRYLERLQGLQQVLGDMNDGIAAQTLLAQFAQEHPELAMVAGWVTGWLANTSQQAELQLARSLKRLKRTPAFW